MAQVKKGARAKVKLLQVGTPPPVISAPPIMEAMNPNATMDTQGLDQLGYDPGAAPMPPGAPQPMQPEMPTQAPPPPPAPQQQPQQQPQPAGPPPPEANVGASQGGSQAAPSAVGSGSPGGNAVASLTDTPQTQATAQQMAQANQAATDHSKDNAMNMMRLASFLPLLAAITGGDTGYASSIMPGVATNLINGQGQFDEAQRQRAFQTSQASFKNGIDERERNVADMNAQTARQKEQNDAIKEKNAVAAAMRQYELDLGKFKQAGQKNDRDNNDSIAKIRGEWSDRLAKLTPDSQEALISSLDPAFKAYYGISLPVGGLETQNPNAPTEDMRLQKDLEAQYDLLKRDPKMLKPGAQKQIVKRIAELQDALGMASDAQLPPEVFANIDPATAQQLRIRVQAEVRANRQTTSNIQHQREGERHDRAMEGVAWENTRLRGAEIDLRKELSKAGTGKNPLDIYMKVTNYLQDLQKQKTALTAGSNQPMTGDYMPPDPQKLADNAATLNWINEQLQKYTNIANNIGGALGIPAADPEGVPLQQGGMQPQQAPPITVAPQQQRPMRQAAPQQRAAPKATKAATPAGNVDKALALLTQSAQNAQALRAELERRARARGQRK